MSDRAELMRALYLEGATLQQIGEKFGVTRERVRQILSEQYGITRTDGGASKRAAARRSIHQNKVSERLMHKWGVSKEEWKKHCDNGLLQAYRYQKNNAVRRGVQFKLTFPEWLSVWDASGKLAQRGRGKDSYCMSRFNDIGAYELGNVHIQTNAGNGRDAVKQWKGRQKANMGVFCLYPGTDRPYVARFGRKQIARCATEQEAAQMRIAYCKEHGIPMSGGKLGRGRGWTYEKSATNRPYKVRVAGTKNTYHATQEEAEAEYMRRVTEVLNARKAA